MRCEGGASEEDPIGQPGLASRDHTTHHTFLGQECELSRKGTNADFERALAMYRQYDGLVDAFGVGGLEFYLGVGKLW